MHDHGFRGIFHLLECGDERFDIVTLFYIQVVESEALEIVVFALALRGSEFREIPVKPAVVFGDGHLVVVHHHDKVRRVFARVVEAFECFAAAQGTVTDDSDHVALFALDIAGGCKSFSEILSHYPLERILSNYHLMHEADITKMAEMIESTL